MTITTMAALAAAGRRLYAFQKNAISAQNPNLTSFWNTGGSPGAGGIPPAVGEVPTSASTGAFPLVNPASGKTLHLARTRLFGNGQPAQGACAVLFDRLVHTSGLSGTVTTAQTVNSPAVNRPDATGIGAQLFLEIYGNIGTTQQVATVSYTNQSGVAGRSGSAQFGGIGYYVAGTLIAVGLQASDTGVRSVESVTLSGSTGTAGNFGVTIARPLAWTPIVGKTAESYATQDHFELALVQIPANACLMLAHLNASVTLSGDLIVAEG